MSDSAADMVHAIAFVELAKEWFGDGMAGIGGVAAAVEKVKSGSHDEAVKGLWDKAGELADAVQRVTEKPPCTVTTDGGVIAFSTGWPPELVEVMRFEPGGNLYIRGELVDTDQDIYTAVLGFMRDSGPLR